MKTFTAVNGLASTVIYALLMHWLGVKPVVIGSVVISLIVWVGMIMLSKNIGVNMDYKATVTKYWLLNLAVTLITCKTLCVYGYTEYAFGVLTVIAANNLLGFVSSFFMPKEKLPI